MWGFVCTTDADGKVFYSFDDEDLFQDQLLNRFVRDYYKPFVVMGTVLAAAQPPKKKRGRGGAGTSGGGGAEEDVEEVHAAPAAKKNRGGTSGGAGTSGRGGAGTSGGGADGDDAEVIDLLANSPRRAASRKKAVEVRLHA